MASLHQLHGHRPVVKHFRSGVCWSIMQVEYATDLIFTSREALAALYEPLVRTAVHAVKAENVATFLGRKLHGNFEGEIGNDFSTRIQGTRIKHRMGPVSVKMYDKHGLVLRIETTANDVSFSNTTGGWYIATGRVPKKSRPCARQSTAWE